MVVIQKSFPLLLGVFVKLVLCYVALLFNTSQSSRIDIAIIP